MHHKVRPFKTKSALCGAEGAANGAYALQVAKMTNETLGLRIKKKRESIRMPTGKKMSQEDLERISGVARRTIQNIENGNVDPQLSSLVALSEAIDLDIKELIFGQTKTSDTRAELFLAIVTRLVALDEEELKDVQFFVANNGSAPAAKLRNK
jgi:transcriptional regulator with XRE-family HTH domain